MARAPSGAGTRSCCRWSGCWTGASGTCGTACSASRWVGGCGCWGGRAALKGSAAAAPILKAGGGELLAARHRTVPPPLACDSPDVFDAPVAQGLALTTRIFWALAGAAFVSASFGLGLLAAASVGAASWQTTGAPLAALLVGGAALAKLAQAAWEFREERFISGVRSWKRAGGLSLVKMPA